MLLTLLTILVVISAIVTLISFVLYVKARMAENEEREQVYKSVHFATLFIFVLLGVLILIILSNQTS